MFTQMCGWTCGLVVVVLACAGYAGAEAPAVPAASAPASAPASRPAPTAAEIRAAVRLLSHPAPARRRAAIRQLAEWGPAAFPELRRVAKSADFEAAISARDLLKELEPAILIGARVRLEVKPARVRWDEPITLTVHAANPTAERILVPWPADGGGSATQPAEGDARQVAAMMDAADFLVVKGPDGEPLDIRVDPIEREPAIYEAVNQRAGDDPPVHPVPAGRSDQLQITAFNRGWARYPMLAAGRYQIAFAYQPKWKDKSWVEDAFGLVVSDPVTVEITDSAPETLRKADTALSLKLKEEGESLIAEMENTWDRRVSVNLNLGGEHETHARLEWRVTRQSGDSEEEPIRWEPEPTDAAFQAKLIRQLKPGERLVIGRAPADVLRKRAREAAADGEWEVAVRYVNLPSPPQLRERLADKNLSVEITSDLFAGSVTSEPLPLKLK